MILKLITGFLLKPILGGIAVITFATGAYIISEQNTGPLEQFVQISGRDAVLFGTGLLAVGVSCIIFYLATWFFTVPLAVTGAILVVVGMSLRSMDSFVPESVMDGYVVDPVTSLVDTYAKPTIDGTVKPLIEMIDMLKP